MAKHQHRWFELGRVFPLTDADYDKAWLSPDGVHHPDHEDGRLVLPEQLGKAGLQAHFDSKVPEPTAHVIVQCQDPDCPDGPKHVEHVELTGTEWGKLVDAHAAGRLDPDGNGTNRLLSQAPLGDLGLGRIESMLSFPSGARETPPV